MTFHTPKCARKDKASCPANRTLHGENLDEHWWSGWPGAICLKCGAEDVDEICISQGCGCPCHAQFWYDYEQQLKREAVR